MSKLNFTIKKSQTSEIDEIYKLESESFPPDEAAAHSTIEFRLNSASDFFYSIYNSENCLIGFINGTCNSFSTIHHDSMTSHDSHGRNLVLHSVTVGNMYRRSGVGSAALIDYINEIRKENRVDNILLLCKAHLISFYLKCGFQVRMLSSVVHGKVLQN